MSRASAEAILHRVWGRAAPITWSRSKAMWRAERTAAGHAAMVARASIHEAFASAPDDIVEALGHWTLLKSRGAWHRNGDAQIKVETWLLAHMKAKPKRATKTVTKGRHHDLAPMVAAVSARYGLVTVPVSWGKSAPKRVASTRYRITLGYYKVVDQTITINRVLDDASVPRFIIEDVLHHELCHHAVPAMRMANGKREAHHAGFWACARRGTDYLPAETWLKTHLPRLLYGDAAKKLDAEIVTATERPEYAKL